MRIRTLLNSVRNRFGMNAVLILPSRTWVNACLQVDGEAGVLDTASGKCVVLTPLRMNIGERGYDYARSIEIVNYSTTPTNLDHVVGDLIEAVIAAVKSFKRKRILIPLHNAPGEVLSVLRKMGFDIENCYEDLKKFLTPISDDELRLLSKASERSWNVLTKILRGEGVDSESLRRCLVVVEDELMEALCREGMFYGYACATSWGITKMESILKAMKLALESLERNAVITSMVNALSKAMESMGLSLINAEFRLWGVSRSWWEAPLLSLGQAIDKPCALAFRLIIKVGSRIELFGSTITVSSKGIAELQVPPTR